MGVYICEFEFVEDGDSVWAWPFWPGYIAGTEGYGLADAVATAAAWLTTMVLDCLAKGEVVPTCGLGHEPERGGKVNRGRVFRLCLNRWRAFVPAHHTSLALRH